MQLFRMIPRRIAQRKNTRAFANARQKPLFPFFLFLFLFFSLFFFFPFSLPPLRFCYCSALISLLLAFISCFAGICCGISNIRLRDAVIWISRNTGVHQRDRYRVHPHRFRLTFEFYWRLSHSISIRTKFVQRAINLSDRRSILKYWLFCHWTSIN